MSVPISPHFKPNVPQAAKDVRRVLEDGGRVAKALSPAASPHRAGRLWFAGMRCPRARRPGVLSGVLSATPSSHCAGCASRTTSEPCEEESDSPLGPQVPVTPHRRGRAPRKGFSLPEPERDAMAACRAGWEGVDRNHRTGSTTGPTLGFCGCGSLLTWEPESTGNTQHACARRRARCPDGPGA